jgi:DNA-binding winged helix-turn-helix (wHTH) protein
MGANRGLVQTVDHDGFEFDYNHNAIFFGGKVIMLSPHEADILYVLLHNRARPTPIGTLIERVYGAKEPDAAAISIRVAIHSLRKKIRETGMTIKAEPKIGYEIEVTQIPELNRRLPDKILVALNLARSTEEDEVAKCLEMAFNIAKAKQQQWLNQGKSMLATVPA